MVAMLEASGRTSSVSYSSSDAMRKMSWWDNDFFLTFFLTAYFGGLNLDHDKNTVSLPAVVFFFLYTYCSICSCFRKKVRCRDPISAGGGGIFKRECCPGDKSGWFCG